MAMLDSDSSKSSFSSPSLLSGTVGSLLTDPGDVFSGLLVWCAMLAEVPDFCNSSNPDGFFLEKQLSVSSLAVDSTTLALSGEGGIPSPPEGAFFMVKISWLHEGHRTDSHRKWMTERTKNHNLNLSNCVWRSWWWFYTPFLQEVLKSVVSDSSCYVSVEMIVMGEYVLIK
jgi:hypothetical protein